MPQMKDNIVYYTVSTNSLLHEPVLRAPERSTCLEMANELVNVKKCRKTVLIERGVRDDMPTRWLMMS